MLLLNVEQILARARAMRPALYQSPPSTEPSAERKTEEKNLPQMEAQNAIGQPTETSKTTLLALPGVGDGTATDDQRQTLLDIMRDAEAKEIEFCRVALTARSLVEEIDVARGLDVGEKTGV